MRVPVFVYGTLRTGEINHYHLAYAEYLGPAQTVRQFSLFIDLASQIPLLVDRPRSCIQGELYLLPDVQALDQIDRLEGHPHDYVRKMIGVGFGGKSHTAWCYFWHHDVDSQKTVLLRSGDFRDR